jgi:hypothetical protein
MLGALHGSGCEIGMPYIPAELQLSDFAAAVDVQLLQNAVHVILDCGGTEAQSAGDLLVGQAAGG